MNTLLEFLVATLFGLVFGFLVAWGFLGNQAFYIFNLINH
jgi:hypothetical protein